MQNNEINRLDVSYTILLEDVLAFFGSISNSTLSKSLIDKSLIILSRFPNAESCAFFKMDTSTFEFEPHSFYPVETADFYAVVFSEISTNGSIGMALQTNRFYIVHHNLTNKIYLILPVFSTKNILGIFVITSIIDFTEIGLNYTNLLMLFARSFGNLIENIELNIKQKQSAELLDQLIASRTIELVENNQALGDKMASLKTNLSMSIPHEVRTPINQILGMTNYLKSIFSQYEDVPKNDKVEVLEIISDIKSSADRLKNLFENFIYHTRLSIISTSINELEQLQSKVSPYCDSIILEQAYLKSQLYDREDDLVVNLVSAHVKMGEEYLAKLVDEVVDNSLKYTQKGDKVSIYSSLESNYYCLTILDQGEGIPPDFLNQVDAYNQFDRQKNEQQGLGLGLAIVFKIVDLHNGLIEINSKVNEFTKVEIKILIADGYQFE